NRGDVDTPSGYGGTPHEQDAAGR
ncbi:MAG: hypothetical protein RL383_1067, partial [Actinomycetota bacterium]